MKIRIYISIHIIYIYFLHVHTHTYIYILFNHKKGNPTIDNNMDKPGNIILCEVRQRKTITA